MLLMLGSEGAGTAVQALDFEIDLDISAILLFRLYAFSGKDKRLLVFLCIQIFVSPTTF